MTIRSILALGLLLCASGVRADDAADAAQRRALLDSLRYSTGTIALPEAQAHLEVKPGFRFLGHDDARKVLEQYWGNPPDDSVLGLLVPDDSQLGLDHSWAVAVTYSDEGYVSDEDAAAIDYDEMLAQLKQEALDANDERKQAGYGTVELVGWAQPPRYDAASKRLHWAKELVFDGDSAHTVNYDIRVLGRNGFLSLNAIADAADLPRVRQGMEQVLPMAQFDAGQQYADYQPGRDVAARLVVGVLLAGVELRHRQHLLHALAHPRQVGSVGDRVQAQEAIAAEHPDVVVDRMRAVAVEHQFLGPVQALAGGVVARRLRPADQLDGAVAGLLALVVGVQRLLLELREHLVVVDGGGVLVGHIAFVAVGHRHRPAVVQSQLRVVRHQQAEHAVVGRVAPVLLEHLAGVVVAEEAEAGLDLQVRLRLRQGDGAGAVAQAVEQGAALRRVGGIVGANATGAQQQAQGQDGADGH